MSEVPGTDEPLKRDWEQTKDDLGLGGQDLDQDVDDTVKQLGSDDGDVTEAGGGSFDGGPQTS